MTKDIKILPLGGLRQVGKNCTLIIYGNEAMMIDCGMGFPGNDEFMNNDFFIPDFDAISRLDIKLKGVIITHGHEDHIGALPYLLKHTRVPVHMTELPYEILKERLDAATLPFVQVYPESDFKQIEIGSFSVDTIKVKHSILESRALIINAGPYKIVHSGDFKSPDEKSPFTGKVPEDVDIFMVDSTNAERKGRSENEEQIVANIEEIINNAPGRVIATCFSSNTRRIASIIKASHKYGRKIGLLGRSVNSYSSIAEKLGHISLPDYVLTDRKQIAKVPEHSITLIVTGSQAEPRSVLKRISMDMFKSVTVKFGDTIFMSSKFIPGNEISISVMIDHLIEKGAEVFYEERSDIHVSGHAKKEEIRDAIEDVSPRLVIPVHGNLRFLNSVVNLAEEQGLRSQMISDGDIFSYSRSNSFLARHIDLETVIVSNGENDLIDKEILRQRRALARSGFLCVMMSVDFLNNALLSSPRIVSEGIMMTHRMKKVEAYIKDMINRYFAQEIEDDPEWDEVEEDIRIIVRRHLRKISGNKPKVFSIIVNKE